MVAQCSDNDYITDMGSAVRPSKPERNMTKTQATEIARAAKAAKLIAGAEDMRLADACNDVGYQIPGQYSYLWGANDTIANLAAVVLKFAKPAQ